MHCALFAADDEPGGLPGGVVIVLLVVGIFVLRWLYTIGFYENALKALAKSGASLAAAAVGLYVLASFFDLAGDLEGVVDRNADVAFVAAGVWLLAGAVTFYPRDPSPAGETRTPAPAAPVAAASGAAYCPSCRGAGQTEQYCGSCNGTGERRCDYRKEAKHWWGAEYVAEWCDAGELKTPDGTEGRCRQCCGRGFVKCHYCRARGSYRMTCERCQGKGTA